jgi:hypothetical protein
VSRNVICTKPLISFLSSRPGVLYIAFLLHCVTQNMNFNMPQPCVVSGFRHDVAEICGHLGYYTVLSGSCVPTFRDNLSVPSSRILTLECRTDDPWRWNRWVVPKTSVQNYHSALPNIPEERRSHAKPGPFHTLTCLPHLIIFPPLMLCNQLLKYLCKYSSTVALINCLLKHVIEGKLEG